MSTAKEVQEEFLRSVRNMHNVDVEQRAQGWPGKTGPDEYFQQRETLLEIIERKDKELADLEEDRKDTNKEMERIFKDNDRLENKLSSIQTDLNKLNNIISKYQ